MTHNTPTLEQITHTANTSEVAHLRHAIAPSGKTYLTQVMKNPDRDPDQTELALYCYDLTDSDNWFNRDFDTAGQRWYKTALERYAAN